MYYILQENLYREYHYKTLLEYLQRYKLPYEEIKWRPFVEDVDVVTDRKDVWVFGSNTLAVASSKLGWNPGSLYNADTHDWEVQSKYYDMLNRNAFVQEIGDPLPEKLPEYFFARPTKDTKSFSGQIFTRASWSEWISDLNDSNLKQKLSEETKVVLASLKTTQQEVRVWVVNGEPITASQYKIGSRVNYLNMDHNEEVFIFVREQAKRFQPAKAFVMDICLWEDEYYVLEVNCINCSGFYDVNMSKLIQSLENTFN
jgi:hypothetical protein